MCSQVKRIMAETGQISVLDCAGPGDRMFYTGPPSSPEELAEMLLRGAVFRLFLMSSMHTASI